MPKFGTYEERRFPTALKKLKSDMYSQIGDLKIDAWKTPEPVPFAQRKNGEAHSFTVGEKWGKLWDCAWFHFTGQIPESAAGKHIILLLDINGEMCVFDENGNPVRGLTNMGSTFDPKLGSAGKHVLQITPAAKGNEAISVWIDAGCNDLFGNLIEDGTIKEAGIVICHDAIRDLYYDVEVALDLFNSLPAKSAQRAQLAEALSQITRLVWSGDPDRMSKAATIIQPQLAKKGGTPSLQISATGHAHIDLAWLWPIRETIRKGARTFSTALDLMDRYPDYIFGCSQPQLFQWMKEYYPVLYERIKVAVKAGRFELQGAMWVEADTNVSSGEGLVRQVLYGKRFFQQEFGIDVTNLWLPDVFGYSAALPQILKKAGVDIFMTQKLSWNQVNQMPHHSFKWEGIDGSTILAHMLPEETYASQAAPNSAKKIEDNYKDKAESEHCLMLYGIGDGGGGPGAEHLERLKRLKNMAGLCPVIQESATDFFKKWRQDSDKFPRWTGELYFERHQGTLTTQAHNKWYNRKMELGLRELEWSAVMAQVTSGQNYPTAALTKLWKDVLLYQFHDILPGSSIKRVYDESLAEYKILFQQVNAALNANDETLAPQIDTSQAKKPAIVQNSLSWPRSEWVKIDDTWQHPTVPAMGYTVIDLSEKCAIPEVIATETLLENDTLKVTFATDGSIFSIWDKIEKREVLDGKPANQFEVYPDLWDAWDFQMDYRDYPSQQMQLQSAQAWIDGPQAVVEQYYQLNQSTLTQQIILTAGSNRLDFVTTVNWEEDNTMLRTSFPVAVHSDQARYEIQYGNLLRPTHSNTTWDLARDEVVGHKWVDLSETGYGVALLNDSKYGHRIKGNVIDLNLLRSMPYPVIGDLINEDPPLKESQEFGDQCEHHFAYALLPHSGDYLAGNVIQQAYQLNIPQRTQQATVQTGTLPAAKSWLEIDNPNVIIESVKKAEDSDAIIVRLYEAVHSTVDVTLTLGMRVTGVEEVNLMEETLQMLTISNNQLALHLTPFEIKTIKLDL